MFFIAFPFVTTALMLSTVSALPQPEEGILVERASAPCPPGSYRSNSTACDSCPAGNTCDGASEPRPCGTGFFQSDTNSTKCSPTEPGYFTNITGSAAQTPCPPGRYQPYFQQSFCYKAPKGRFQQQSGKAFACETCCGWSTSLPEDNVNLFKCSGLTPYAKPGSNGGCIEKNTAQCVTPDTCAQSADGTCPAETISN
ncbi:hypothetical protein K438DRAFT_2010191 [Mycena galopus ATCC 62051]|nr:hypothetical protein K438DRAFT_2010191 [Mycena galopus ATCC 62051]